MPHSTAARELHLTKDRNLAECDLDSAAGSTEPVQPLDPIQNLRSTHHRIARLLAQGYSKVETSHLVGMSPATIGRLEHSPAFKELRAHYAERVDEVFEVTAGRIADLSLAAMEELHHRILTEPDKFDNKDLQLVATAMLDRSGHGPTSKQEVSHGLSSDTISALRERSQQNARGTVVDAQTHRPQNTRPDDPKLIPIQSEESPV